MCTYTNCTPLVPDNSLAPLSFFALENDIRKKVQTQTATCPWIELMQVDFSLDGKSPVSFGQGSSSL